MLLLLGPCFGQQRLCPGGTVLGVSRVRGFGISTGSGGCVDVAMRGARCGGAGWGPQFTSGPQPPPPLGVARCSKRGGCM